MSEEQKSALLEELNATFEYDAAAGELRRKKPKGRKPNGKRRSQYVEFRGRKRVTASQVVWAMQYSIPTPPKIYHLDNDRTNLKLENLHYKRPPHKRGKETQNGKLENVS
jgi:hypothetical protein